MVARPTPAFYFKCLPENACDKTPSLTYVEHAGQLKLKITNPKSAPQAALANFKFSVLPEYKKPSATETLPDTCTKLIQDPSISALQTRYVETFWTDENSVDFAIEKWTITYE